MRKELALHFALPVCATLVMIWLSLSSVPQSPAPLQQAGTAELEASSQKGPSPFWQKLLARVQASLVLPRPESRKKRFTSLASEIEASPLPEAAPREGKGRPATIRNILKSAEAHLILNPGSEEPVEIAIRNRSRLRKLTATATKIQALLGECLVRDLCGQEASDDSPYFDRDNTEAHRLLNRALQFLKASADLEPLQAELPGDSELLERLKIENSETQTLALALLLRNGANSSLCSEIISQARLVKDDAKSNLFAALNHPGVTGRERQRTGCERGSVLSALNESLRRDDPNTVAKVVAGLDRFALNEQEYTSAVVSLCRFRTDAQLRATVWNEVRMHLGKIHEKNSFGVDPDSLCAPQGAVSGA